MTSIEGLETMLRQCCLLSSLSEDERDALGAIVSVESVEPNDVVFREGEPGDHFFLVVSGTVRITTRNRDGREQAIALLGPGQTFGEMALLDQEPRSATAVTGSRSTLVRIDETALDHLDARFPGFRSRFQRDGLRLMSSRLRAANARYWELAGRSARERSELTQSRARLLSLVSHELRTPLTIIKGSAQLLLHRNCTSPATFLKKIVAQSDHLAELVDDLITLSLLQGPTGLSETTDFDAAELARTLLEEFAPAAQRRMVRLALLAPQDDVYMSGDRPLIARALYHLVDNAVKFSPSRSEVVVQVERLGDTTTRFVVKDHGEGIPKDKLARVLESFVQDQDPLTRDVEGMGIGLSLVNEVMRAHGGRLLVDSEPSQGSRFTMELGRDAEEVHKSLTQSHEAVTEEDYGDA